MKNQRKTEIRVGITVLIGVIVFLWVLGWAKDISFDSDRKELIVSFESVAGLNVGDAVTLKGIRKGSVENIFIEDNSAFVKISLDENVNLKSDATFSIMVLDLMGGKKVEIDPGTSLDPINYSNIQNGIFLGDISTTMSMLGSVQGDLVEVIYEVKKTLKSMNKLLGDDNFTEKMNQSVNSLNRLINKTDKLISDNNETIGELLKNSNELVKTSNDLISENKTEIKDAVNNINNLVKNTDSLVLKLDDFVNEVKSKENNLGKVIYDEEFISDLKVTLNQLKELSDVVLQQLKGKGFKVDADIW